MKLGKINHSKEMLLPLILAQPFILLNELVRIFLKSSLMLESTS